MANKNQVLELLAKGLTPQQIAKKLKCSDAYVRATRFRATPNGSKRDRDYCKKYYWEPPAEGKSRKRFRGNSVAT